MPVVRVLIRPRSLSSFQYNGVITHVHIATIYQYVVANIKVYGITARCATLRFGLIHILGRRVYVAVYIADVVATVQMIGPERTVYEADILHRDVTRV